MSLINIAKNAKVTFSSKSQWSTDDDYTEIVTAEHQRDFSFHTNKEQNPWVELDLGDIYVLHNIVVFNRKNSCQVRAYTLQVAISSDKKNYELIHKGFIPFKEKIEFNLASLKTARYVKLSLNSFDYFHLSKIEVLIDESKNSGLIFDNQSIPDKIKFNTFYIGSCRYMELFPKHFPARLHTTKEIINYLNNYNKIDLDMVDANYIYGDLLHPIVKKDSITYCNSMNHIFDSVSTVFIEISSRKYVVNNGIVYNNFYYNKKDKKVNIIKDKELFSDLLHIKYLLKNMFGIESIIIIPHINLLLDNGEKIDARDQLKNSLENICKKLKIEFLDINNAFPEGSYFKDIAPDTKHYSKKGNYLASKYINNFLYKKFKTKKEHNAEYHKNKETKKDIDSSHSDSLKTTQFGSTIVSIPAGYKLHKKGLNGVLFKSDKSTIGLYEVPQGLTFEKKVNELDKKYNNTTKIHIYTNNNVTFKSVFVKDANDLLKEKETYFEKNNMRYHIYENGVEDHEAFETILNSIKFNFELLNQFVDKVKKIPQLSCTSFGYSTDNGKIRYYNWRSQFSTRTLLDDFNGFCNREWFTRYLNYKFPDENYKINFIGPFERHHTLNWPMNGKKVFYSGEDLNHRFLEMKEKFDMYALDYVDLALGHDLIDNEKYLRFPFWAWYQFPPEITEETIENSIDLWNSANYKKTRDVVNISSHDNWNSRTIISNDVEKIVEIAYAGKWRNNTDELWNKYNNKKLEYIKQFKFNICPENVMSKGYVTEKIFDSIKADCIPLYAGGKDYMEPKVLNHNAILRWNIGENVDNSDTIEFFRNLYSDKKTYDEFKDQNILLDSSKKYIIKLFSNLEKHFERLIFS